MKKVLLIAALLAAPALAQQLPAPVVSVGPDTTLLNLSVQSEVRRAPDIANFSAGVVTQAKTAGEAIRANAERMNAVVAALKRAGFAGRDIQTAQLSLQPRYHYPERERMRDPNLPPPEPQAPRIIGYEARNTVQVRVRRLGEMGRTIDTLIEAGANQVDGPMFMLENQDAALDAARADAVRKARARAELYAKAAGLRVARIISMSEGGSYFPPPEIVVTGARMGAAAAPPPPPSPVSPGELTLGIQLQAQFALER